MPTLPQLDHTVINVRYDMDRAERRFQELGFSLTDRGYHTLGSINHLMMFGHDYLELIGLPEESKGQTTGRQDIANAPLGINGLVFKTSDVDATFAHLQSVDLAGDPPKSFSRPVELPDGRFDAKFRTVNVRHDVFSGGRVYFCEHGTPELVWRPEWQSHAIGARAMPEFIVASDRHAVEADAMARLVGGAVHGDGAELGVAIDGAVISFLSKDAYRARYGDLASAFGERTSIFGAIVIRVDDLDTVRGQLKLSKVDMRDQGERIAMRETAYDSVFEFVT